MASAPDLNGHTALVTGSGRRLGRAFVERLAQLGADVVVHYGRSAAEAEEVVAQVQRHGIRAAAVQADLSRPEQAAGLIPAALRQVGQVDLLVNSASIFEPLEAAETSLEAWQRHMSINLTAPFLISQAFAVAREGAPGSIVNMLDWRALRPGTDHFAYSISKAGLAALTRGLALSLAPSIRVNGLAPGAILPPADGGGADALQGVPAGRWGSVEELVDALLFLLVGPPSVTGEILLVDGGRHLT